MSKKCKRCGVTPTGSHYHCAGCDSSDVTGGYGHYKSMHMIDGKFVNTDFHHCAPGDCSLESK